MKRSLFLVSLIVFGLAACGAESAPITSTSQSIEWTYLYDIQNYERECPISQRLSISVVMQSSGFSVLSDAEWDELLSIQDCRRDQLNDYINDRGKDGWEMLAFEMMTDTTSGIESAYRIMWKKPAD